MDETKYTWTLAKDPMVVGLYHYYYFKDGKKVGHGQGVFYTAEEAEAYLLEQWDDVCKALDAELLLYGAA